MLRFFTSWSFLLASAITTLDAALVNGPMLAHVAMREAKVWVQADTPSTLRVAYSPEGDQANVSWSASVPLNAEQGYAGVAILDQVEAGRSYTYRIELDGELVTSPATFKTPVNFLDRTPPPDFKIAVGGAHYVVEDGFEPPYRILGGGYDIFETIAMTQPELMIWAGNTAHLRNSDWTTKSGYIKRFAKARSIPQLDAFLQSVPQYATWSEFDFGAPNGGWHSSYRTIAEKSFEAFWPRPVEVDQLEGVATQFRYSDVDFFMLDVRSYRKDTPDSTGSIQILGSEQTEWLLQALIRSTATFKVIIAGAPILNPADSRSNLSYAEGEHTDFLQKLRDARISGLFFISGGKAYGELTRLVHANSYNLHDLTVGPLTAAPGENDDELNFFRMPGSSTFERHFALIEFSGPEDDRTLTMRVMSLDGKELWSRSLQATSLQPAK